MEENNMSNKKTIVITILCLLFPLLAGCTVFIILQCSYKTYTYTYELSEIGSDDGHDISILSVTKTKRDDDNLAYAPEGQTYVIIKMQCTNNREDASYYWSLSGDDFKLLVDGMENGVNGQLDLVGEVDFSILFGLMGLNDLDFGETKTITVHFLIDDTFLENEMKLSYNCTFNDDVGHESRVTLVWKLT